MTVIRRYSELRRLPTFEERFDYLKLPGSVGISTLGFDRYLGQAFYRSYEWKHIRDNVIARDNGCDLGIPGYEIYDAILVHHINPMNINDLVHGDENIVDPQYLITTTHKTHNAIHYGNRDRLYKLPVKRSSGDTKLW